MNRPILRSGDRSSVEKKYRLYFFNFYSLKSFGAYRPWQTIDFPSPTISKHQFGFLRKRSAIEQLLIHKILSSLSTRSLVDVKYLDISKAFDLIPHGKLLMKLWSARNLSDLLVRAALTPTPREPPGNYPCGASRYKTCPILAGP